MTIWDALTWAAVAVLGPGVLVVCLGVARDLRRLLAPPPASPDPAPGDHDRPRP